MSHLDKGDVDWFQGSTQWSIRAESLACDSLGIECVQLACCSRHVIARLGFAASLRRVHSVALACRGGGTREVDYIYTTNIYAARVVQNLRRLDDMTISDDPT